MNTLIMRLSMLCLILFVSAGGNQSSSTYGALIVTYDMSERPTDGDPFQAPYQVDPLMSASDMTLGSGLAVHNHPDAFDVHDFDQSPTFNPANNDYFTFTVSPDAGVFYSLSTLRFADRRENHGPASMLLRTSLDGFTGDVYAWNPTTTLTDREISFGAEFSNLTAPLELRIYGYNADINNGDYQLHDHSVAGYVELQGFTAIPEPSSFALVGLVTAGVGYFRRRRQKLAASE